MVASACAGSLEDKSFYNSFSPFSMSASLNPLANSNTFNGESTSNQRKSSFLIIDARSYAAALANRAMGGGLEYPGKGTSLSPINEFCFHSFISLFTIAYRLLRQM